jgi:acetolactate synthase-1/2/3 large subunit
MTTEPNTAHQGKGTSVAEAYLSALHACGVKYVFANGGTDFAPIIESLVAMSGQGQQIPNFMTVPHENVAIAMAQGYSKISGEPSCVMVHVNVGTANTICGLMNAARDNVPVLLAAGRTPVSESGLHGSRDVPIHWAQENFDQAGIVREHVKWDYELRSGQPVNTMVLRALDIAMSQPKGPVYLTLPREVLAEHHADHGSLPRGRALGAIPAAPSFAAIEQAADMIAKAEAPLIIAGHPSSTREAFHALGELVHENALMFVQGGAYHNIASSNPMHLGLVSHAIVEKANLIVVLDSAVPWMPAHIKPKRDAKFVHIAHDPLFSRYPFRGFEMDLAVAGDPAAAIGMLRDALRDRVKGQAAGIEQRRRKIADLRAAQDEKVNAAIAAASTMAPISPLWVAACLNKVKEKDAIISDELGVPFPALDLEQPDCWISSSSGALGMGIGQMLGAKVAAPHRQVIGIVGDGSYMFGVPTAAHFVQRAEKIPTLTLVMNNSQWFAVRRATLSMYPDGHASKANQLPVVELAPSVDYEKIVEACGGHGEKVEDPAKLESTLRRSLEKVASGTAVTLAITTRPRG